MTELIEAEPPVGHIPGAGIDFARVGRVHVIEPEQVEATRPRTAMPGFRLAAPERLLTVAVVDAAVGDLLVTAAGSARGALLGRPMQVLHVGADTGVVALDDHSLPASIEVDPSVFSTLGSGEPSAAWHVLAACDIARCPRCQAPGHQVVYGLVGTEPTAGWVIGGCCVPWLGTDFRCPRCQAEWPQPALADGFDSARD